MSSLKYWVWLSSLSGFGSVAAGALLNRFGTPENVFKAGPGEYSGIDGIRQEHIAQLSRKNMDEAERIMASCYELGYRVIALGDAAYPERLRNIYDPPVVLYARGSMPDVDEEAVVAVVGTRDCTPYGVNAADVTGYRLARSGLIVVTGMARGVDTAATRGALKGGGKVIGVIGSGLDVVYPPESGQLYDEVARCGVLLSEFPPGTLAKPAHFPMRNRILSGISLGVAVIEAPKKSGALITAARALEQGRDVFALPGNVDARSCEGSNSLLREGAIPFLSADDIVAEYSELFPDKIRQQESSAPPDSAEGEGRPAAARARQKKEIDKAASLNYIDFGKILGELNGDERAAAEAIGAGASSVDDVIIRSGLGAGEALAALSMLEIKGYAERGEGNSFTLINKV